MADKVPLSVISSLSTLSFHAQVAIGKEIISTDKRGFWFLVVDRSTLKVVNNINQTSNTTAPDLGQHNNENHILLVATAGIGLDKTPQGDLFKFIDLNGGGRELRHVEQIGQQFNCGSYGTFGYAMVGVLGNLNKPGFELSDISGNRSGPFLTLSLVPTTIGGKTIYTPKLAQQLLIGWRRSRTSSSSAGTSTAPGSRAYCAPWCRSSRDTFASPGWVWATRASRASSLPACCCVRQT